MKTAIKRSISRGFLVVFCIVAVAAGAKGDNDLIPIEHFARKPQMQNVTLSPDGQRLAFLVNEEGKTVLVTYDLEKEKRHIITSVDNDGKHFSWISWANNRQLLVSLRHPERDRSVKYYETTLLVVDWQGGDMQLVSEPRQNVNVAATLGQHEEDHERRPQFMDRVIADLPQEPDHILLSADFEMAGRPGVYKINLQTQARHKLMEPVADVRHWVGDQNGEWLAGVGFDEGVKTVYVRKIGDNRSKRVLWQYDVTKKTGPKPIGFDSKPDRLIVRAPLDGRMAIYAVDYHADELDMELLASDETYDIAGALIWAPARGRYVGAYYEGAQGRYVYWDEEFKALQKGIEAALPPGTARILTFSDDENRYVAAYAPPGAPPVFLLGDRENKKLGGFSSAYPELKDAELPVRKPVSLKARDGLELEGYLTLPHDAQKQHDKDNKKGTPMPAVVLPHGGPSGRDTAAFHPWAAFLASRGYAVLQVNFRGSVGYGTDFARAQMQNWGGTLQDDVTDATQWLIEEGVADPERICIVGHSYGGYASLMGAVKTPDLFRCAVSSAGVTDLLGIIGHHRAFASDEILNMQFGSRFFDRGRLKETSPVHNVEKVKIPVLLIHGDEDRVVPVEQSEDMADELESEDKDVRLIVQEGGDHYYSRYRHHLEFLSELEDFLAEHIGT